MREVRCDYCGTLAEFIDSKEIYGRSYGMVYFCRNCKAYVGVHKGSDRPLGRLANAELRAMKHQAHRSFDRIWRSHEMSRPAAYRWLALQMGLTREEAHIGMFDVDQCKLVIKLCENRRKGELP